MMKQLKTIFLSVIFISSVKLTAQNEVDALRYSNINFFGTARFNSMGGAFTALGGDFSSLSLNPAGMGIYRKSEIVITPAFDLNTTNTNSLNNSRVNDSKFNTNIANISYLGNFNAASHDWISWSFAFGYNRLANFNTQYTSQITSNRSLLQDYVDELNSYDGTYEGDIPYYYPFDIDLAYQTYLINPLLSDTMRYSHELQQASAITKYKNVTTRGGMGETYLGFGGNLNDVLYVGASINFPRIRYIEDVTYTETVSDADTAVLVKDFTQTNYLKTTGTGTNLKLGLIYRALDWLRIGAAIHSSTYFRMYDTWNSAMRTNFKDNTFYVYNSPIGKYEYSLRTPFRVETGVGIVVAQMAAISIDYEYVDYTTAQLKPYNDTYAFTDENNNIKDFYKNVHNIRIGAEVRATENISLRAGFRWYDNPYVYAENPNKQIYSVGVGYKTDNYYIDLGYFIKKENYQSAFHYANGELIKVNSTNQNLTFSFGIRF